MAFADAFQFPEIVGKHVVFWDGFSSVIGGGGSVTGAFFHLGGVGAMKEILIQVEAIAASGTPTFNVFWKGATVFNLDLSLAHEFWTGVTTSTTNKTYFYYGNNTGQVDVIGGAGVVSEGMYNINYLAFGLKNTGATDITVRIAPVGVLS